MKKVFISRNYKGIESAGGKAKTDVELILQGIGFKNIGWKQSSSNNKIIDFVLNITGILKAVIRMPSKGILFLQYPMKKYYTFICGIAHLKDTKIITLIHDLGTFRRQKLTVDKEITLLNNSDYIIALNKSMAKWLEENNYKGQTVTLDIWDYLSKYKNTSSFRSNDDQNYVVNYAGGLSRRKNLFLYEFSKHVDSFIFNLYGTGFEPTEQELKNPYFVYKGFVQSDDLISSITGDFGLVWDGDSIDTCSGSFGSYLQFNNPHKVSLYIRCHLPVIIWNQAAMVSFVLEHGVGFSINSLSEIKPRLLSLTKEEYNEMKRNTIKLSLQIESGYYIKQAMNKIKLDEK